MDLLPLPNAITITPDEKDANRASIVIEPCYPGYGTTLGNALRRVLLSSLPGAAVSRVKINGVVHEFSTLPNVQEDIVDMLLNIKQLRVKLHEGTSGTIIVKAKGETVVKGKDLDVPSNVEVTTPDLVIATLTDKSAELDMELTVEEGRGYVPVEAQSREKPELGVIAVDAIFTPVRMVNFDTENVRVGQMTNYDKLTLDVMTDGTVTPSDAFHEAAEILSRHFSLFSETKLESGSAKPKRGRKKAEGTEEAPAEETAPEAKDASQEEA